MHSRLAQMFALLVAAFPAQSLHAGVVNLTLTAPDVGSTAISGTGSFSYTGSLASIGLGDLTSFAFELDFSNPGSVVNPIIVDFGLPDLMSFSANVSGGVVTALSLTTAYEAAINSSSFNENQKNLVVTSLASGGAAIYNQEQHFGTVTLVDTGTITAAGPGAPVPEPSALLLVSGALLPLAFSRRHRPVLRG